MHFQIILEMNDLGFTFCWLYLQLSLFLLLHDSALPIKLPITHPLNSQFKECLKSILNTGNYYDVWKPAIHGSWDESFGLIIICSTENFIRRKICSRHLSSDSVHVWKYWNQRDGILPQGCWVHTGGHLWSPVRQREWFRSFYPSLNGYNMSNILTLEPHHFSFKASWEQFSQNLKAPLI